MTSSPWSKVFAAAPPPSNEPVKPADPEDLMSDDELMQRLNESIAAVAKICHPHTVALMRLFQERKLPVEQGWATLCMARGMLRASVEINHDDPSAILDPDVAKIFETLGHDFTRDMLKARAGRKPKDPTP